ncbi:LysR family transcriptional regulator [Staphylospora marina]|uniref:LysR family transcriptional regulator n=1 Tax=Staphylospora marina TaxID=2490858 RepID=UPI000F5BD7EE|nr:LysR family transcriptional regulator [Staphylospora marina]
MEWRHLHTFKTVVDAGGMTRAAKQLGYAQSSVTAQIQALEEELGLPLFDRLGKKIVLTEAGNRLYEYAVKLLSLHGEALEAVRSGREPAGTLVIGSPESLAAFRLPPIIREYRRRFPRVKLVLEPGSCQEMRRLVKSGELDVAFIMETDMEDEDPELVVEPLVTEEMALIAPHGHPLADLPEVKAEHLAGESFLHTETGCSYRALFERYLLTQGIRSEEGAEFWSIEAIKNCVHAGLGLACLPLIAVRKEIEEGKLLRLNWDDRSCRVTTFLVHNRKKWVSPALEEWIGIVRENADRWTDSNV